MDGLNLVSPNLKFAPCEIIGGIRRFHLRAEEIHHQLVDGVHIKAWGYNGSTPGPVIVAYQGERIQIVLHNTLSVPTSIHWHGLLIPNYMDGVPAIGAGPYVNPGEQFVYDFVLQQTGTYMYHSHVDPAMQETMGLSGMFIALPVDHKIANREYVLLLQEWSVQDGKLNPESMDFNYFTINGKCFPDTLPLLVKQGEKVRIRLGNLSMNSHPMHLHGHYFQVLESDGVRLPVPFYKNTINVAPGETWDIEFVANNPGNWAFHCHKPHHTSNGHGSNLGGMFTYVKYMN